MTAPDVFAFIKYARSDDTLRERARVRFAAIAPSLFGKHAVELSASSAGRCKRELWAYLHGKLDIPENFDTVLMKMDLGTLNAAWCAALFAVAYTDANPGSAVDLEGEVEHDGIPGHIDIAISRDGASPHCDHVVELKATFWPLRPDKVAEWTPPLYHRQQACVYSAGKKAPRFSVVTFFPAAQRSGATEPTFCLQHDYETAEEIASANVELARMREALADERPDADPKEAWRCATCLFSGCDKNRNPLGEALLRERANIPADQAKMML